MLIVGLTGGIGAGKSTAARLFAGLGAEVIDVDRLRREVLEPGGRAYEAVRRAFGPQISAPDGTIDRAALGAIVFSDPAALDRLTAISHPAINAELARRIESLAAGPSGGPPILILDMAVLVESELGRADETHRYRAVVTVEAPDEVRVRRAVARGMAEHDVRNRMAAQTSSDRRRAAADVVIDNDGTEADLAAAVGRCWDGLLARAADTAGQG